MDALFEMSNAITTKFIEIHERREAVAAKSRAAQAPPVECSAPAAATLFEMMVAEEKIQKVLAEDMARDRAPVITGHVDMSEFTSAKEVHGRSLPIRQPPSRGLQGDRKAKMMKSVKQNHSEKVIDGLEYKQNLKKAETVDQQKKKAFADAVKQSLEAEKTRNPVVAEETKLTTELKQLKADMSVKAAGKAMEQDALLDAAIEKHESDNEVDADEEHEEYEYEGDSELYESWDNDEDVGFGIIGYDDLLGRDFPSEDWGFGDATDFGAQKDDGNDSMAIMDGELENDSANLRHMQPFEDERDFPVLHTDDLEPCDGPTTESLEYVWGDVRPDMIEHNGGWQAVITPEGLEEFVVKESDEEVAEEFDGDSDKEIEEAHESVQEYDEELGEESHELVQESHEESHELAEESHELVEESHKLVEESYETSVEHNEELDQELANAIGDSEEEFEDSEEEAVEESGEESDENTSDGESDEDVYEAVDLHSEEETVKGDMDIEDNEFVLIDADEAAGAPEQPWSPNERTRARACVVM